MRSISMLTSPILQSLSRLNKAKVFYVKLKLLQALNFVAAPVGLVMAYQHNQLHLLWVSLAVILVQTVNVVCGLHRLFAHRSYETNKWFEIFSAIFVVYATFGSTITWVAVHRAHHARAEKIDDPHSPYTNRDGERKLSLWRTIKVWLLFLDQTHIPSEYKKPLADQKVHVLTHKYYFTIIFVTCALLWLINPWLVLFAYVIQAWYGMFVVGSLASIGHIHGYKTHNLNNEARNSWILSIITLGDGWHNNHHAHPGNWTTQEKWWELDPCGWFIRLIKKN